MVVRFVRTTWGGVAEVALAVLLVGGIFTVAGGASTTPNLPPLTPEQLVASTIQGLASPPPVAGHVSVDLGLGLPQLPNEGPAAFARAGDLISYLLGDHRLHVWRSSGGVRLTDLLPLAEKSLVVSVAERDAWAWDSESYTAYHLRGPGDRPGAGGALATGGTKGDGYGPIGFPAGLLDPVKLAGAAIAAITPTTAVSVSTPVRVAGRAAYELVLEPRSGETLVGSIRIDVDAERHVPLGVLVFARGASKPAISVVFTGVSFDPIEPSTFRFSPPPGAKVVEASDLAGHGAQEGSKGLGLGEYLAGPPRLFGHDWETIVAVPVSNLPEIVGGPAGALLSRFLPFSGPLLSVRLVDRGDHGWLVYGAVPQKALAAVDPELA
jgi:hypothetical protein